MTRRSAAARAAVVALALGALGGCAYFNTFYNARKYYAQGEKLARAAPEGAPLPAAARTAFERSIEKSSAVLARHADSDYIDDALLLLGKAHVRIGNFAEGATALKTLVEEHAESGLRREAMLWLLRAGRESGDLATAASISDDLLGGAGLSAADRVLVELERAELAVAQDDPASAVAIYEKLLRQEPQLAARNDVDLRLARARLAAGDPAGSLEDLRAIIAAGATPDREHRAAVAMAEAFVAAGESEQARETYRGLLAAGVSDSLAANVRLALAQSYVAAGDAPAAAEEFGAAARTLPSTPLAATALYHRGLIEWRQLGARNEAKETFLEAFLQDPEGAAADSATLAARTIAEIQHYASIVDGSSRVMAPIPDDEVQATASYLLAELLYTQEGDVTGARELFARILERQPRSIWIPKVLYTLGWLAQREPAHSAGGSASEAAAFYRRLVAEHPGTQYAEFATERLAELEGSPPPSQAQSGQTYGQPIAHSEEQPLASSGEPSAAAPEPQPAATAGPLSEGTSGPESDGRSGAFDENAAAAGVLAPRIGDEASVAPAASPPMGTIPSALANDPLLARAPTRAEVTLDEQLMAFSLALPKPTDPLLGIKDRLLARRVTPGAVTPGHRGLSPAELEHQLEAEEQARAIADSSAAAADTSATGPGGAGSRIE